MRANSTPRADDVPVRVRVKQKKYGLRWCLAILLLLILLLAIAFANLNPILLNMAEARARQLAVRAINEAVAQVVGNGLAYADLVSVVTDDAGRVQMIKANTLRMNELASKTALAVQQNLSALENQGVDIPLGAAFGISLFGGAGPRIPVRVLPVGSVTTRFVTSFETAGINQTRHEISLEAQTSMRLVIPTGADSVSVTAYVPVAESIIVGNVPDSYVNVPDTNSSLNVIP